MLGSVVSDGLRFVTNCPENIVLGIYAQTIARYFQAAGEVARIDPSLSFRFVGTYNLQNPLGRRAAARVHFQRALKRAVRAGNPLGQQRGTELGVCELKVVCALLQQYIAKTRIDLVIRRAELDYLSSLRPGEKARVTARPFRKGKFRFYFEQEIIRLPEKTPVIKALMTVACVVDGKPAAPVELEEWFGPPN